MLTLNQFTPKRFSVGLVLLTGFLGGLGLVMVQGGWHTTASQQVVAEAVPVTYTVVLQRVTSLNPKAMFTLGQMATLTVRNRPRGDVRVTDVAVIPKKVVVPGLLGGKFGQPKWIPDANHPYEADVVLTLADTATQTRQGYVAKGVKIKAGMKVTLEDFDTYEDGVIADVVAQPATTSGGSV